MRSDNRFAHINAACSGKLAGCETPMVYDLTDGLGARNDMTGSCEMQNGSSRYGHASRVTAQIMANESISSMAWDELNNSQKRRLR
jgi:hypothetical protein